MAVNTHFDHIGEEARRQSALLIIKKIKEIVGERPAIVTGDFNVTDASSAYETITTNEFVMKDAYKIAGHVTGVDYTSMTLPASRHRTARRLISSLSLRKFW